MKKQKFTIGTQIFLYGISATYFIAFISLWLQIEGLFGLDGIMPVQQYFESISKQENILSFILNYPSIIWLDQFFNLGNNMLHLICLLGCLSSIISMVNYYRGYSLILCWILYLSLTVMGSPFLNFQWDILLLESGFLSIFLAGFSKRNLHPSPYILFLLYLLLFRIMFFSGYVKLASNDPVWWNLSALSIHFETQPLPHAISWYFHQLPGIILKIGTAIMFIIELLMPFFIFTGRRLRHIAGISFIIFMLVIGISGNYTFFNLLTIIICIPLFDNQFFKFIFPFKLIESLKKINLHHIKKYTRISQKSVFAIMLVLIIIFEGSRWLPMRQYPFISSLYQVVQPFRLVNNYGLFANMTTKRPEIIFEISTDGNEWEEIQFKWKPVNLGSIPGFVQPHQPRLDWQLWFASLYYERVLNIFNQQYKREPKSYNEINYFIYNNFRQAYYRHVWVHNFMMKILEKKSSVINLLADYDLPEGEFYLQAWLYDYNFTNFGDENWWKRSHKRLLFPPFNLN